MPGRGVARSLAVGAIAVCLPLEAAAAKRSKHQPVALIVLPHAAGDRGAVSEVRRALLSAFARERRVLLVDPYRAAGAETRAPREPIDTRRAGELIGARRYRAAVRLIQRRLRAAEAAPNRFSKASVANASLQLAFAQLGARRPRAAGRTLYRLLIWRPSLTERLATRSRHAAWDRLVMNARKAIAATPTGSVEIRSTPPGAEVFIDGKRIGTTPVHASNLLVGSHKLTVKLGGYEPAAQRLAVKGRPRALAVRLQPDPIAADLRRLLADLARGRSRHRRSTLRSLRRRAGVDRALVVRVRRADGRVRLRAAYYDLRTGAARSRTRLAVPHPAPSDALAPLALWRLHAPSPARGRPIAASTPWHRRWWVWVAAAGVVAASAAIPIALDATSTQRARDSAEAVQLRW